jgi:hypothetical protein
MVQAPLRAKTGRNFPPPQLLHWDSPHPLNTASRDAQVSVHNVLPASGLSAPAILLIGRKRRERD